MSYPQSGQNSGAYGQPDYGQQYGQPAYGQPQYPQPSQGLPPLTPRILAAVVGGLGVLQLFLGFLGVASIETPDWVHDIPAEYRGEYTSQDSPKIFESWAVMPYVLLALVGLLALATLVIGTSKQLVSLIASLGIAAMLVTIFQFASFETGDEISYGAGFIVLLIFSILIALVSIFWWIVAAGFVKVASTPQAPAAPYYG